MRLNMRTIISTLLVGFTLSGSLIGEVKAETYMDEYLSNIKVINQKDEWLQTSKYKYNDNYFGNNGCGPSSLTNGLLTLFNVTDNKVAGEITEEVLRLFTYKHNKQNKVTLNNLSLLDLDIKSYLEDKSESYPNLYSLVSSYSGDIVYMKSRLATSDLIEYINNDNSYIFIYKLCMQDNWKSIIEIINTLYDNGRFDANMIFTFISAGTVNTSGPFRSGEAGHYLTFVLNVKEFYENASIYVLDSYQRGLEEEYGEYKSYYDFANIKKSEFSNFYKTYNVTRIADNVLEVSLTDLKLNSLHSLLNNSSEMVVDGYRMMLLEPLITYGTGAVMLSVSKNEYIKTR